MKNKIPAFALAICLTATLVVRCSNTNERYQEWRVTGGTKENIRYSTLDQIDTTNVNQLEVAWIYHTGDADTARSSQMQCNPIIVDGVMYCTSPQLKVLALDAATGQEKWRFDAKAEEEKVSPGARFILNNNRGVAYWEDKEDKRILFTAGPYLYAISATAGKSIASFGTNGRIDMHEGLGRDVTGRSITSTTPGVIFKDLLIIGSSVSEGPDAAPGHIRAFDVRTGQQRWIFHTIPHPGEVGFDSWEDSTAYKNIGGANSWSGLSLDEDRGMVFAPTGSASFDFYGGMRKGKNLFANSVLALDAATGKYIWHFQTIHHDVWDRDIPTAPSLVNVTHNGKQIDAIAQPTKGGFIFLFERETGNPLFPIEEVPVPTNSALVGEKLHPTQPIPTLPKAFMRQTFTEADLNHLIPDSSYQDIKKRFLESKSGHMFTPPAKEGTIFFPGLDGGAEWGGVAFDPATGWMYINANEIPWLIGIKDVLVGAPENETYLEAGTRLYKQYCMACHGPERNGAGNYPSLIDIDKRYTQKTLDDIITTGRRMMPALASLTTQQKDAIASFILDLKSLQRRAFKYEPVFIDSFRNLPYTITGYTRFQTKEGYPANSPPWGTLNAVNLNTGEIEWRIPFGEYPELTRNGLITGTENYGGPVVTSNGVLFIAATRDEKFRAFNKLTGKLLWETSLPASGFATPAVYEVNGKEYVVIGCGGGKVGAKSGDAYVAFALP